MRRRLSTEIDKARALLKCKAGASQEEIRAAFRKAALRVHPDQRGNASEFVELCAAAELLKSQQAELPSTQRDKQDPWQEALARVKFGPPFRVADDGFPDAFEMEERNVGKNDGPILKLVHGRYEFGDVRQVAGGLELHLEGRVAQASRRGSETTIDDVRLVRSAAPSPVIFGFGGFASSIVINAQGDTVYGLYESKTPGVESMVWHRGAVLATVSRAWMPPDSYWLPFFQGSRSPGYGSDGRASSFYFQRRRSFPTTTTRLIDSSPKKRLDPAVCVFAAAFHALDRLRGYL